MDSYALTFPGLITPHEKIDLLAPENFGKTAKDLQHNLPADVEHTDLLAKARKAAMADVCKAAFKADIAKNPQRYFRHAPGNDMDMVVIEHLYEQALSEASCFLFFTINLKPEVQSDFDTILKVLYRAGSKVWVNRWIAVLEHRGSEEHMGTHVHMLVEKKIRYETKRPSACKQEMYNTWKKMVGNELHVNMQKNMFAYKFLKYVLGQKKSAQKRNQVNLDRLWRQQMGLQDTYGDWNEIPGEHPVFPVGEEQPEDVIALTPAEQN